MENERLSFYIDKKITYVNISWTTNRNMYLKVVENEIVVSANKRTKLETINAFVAEHIGKFVKYLNEKIENELFSLSKGIIWINGTKFKIQVLTGFKKRTATISSDVFYVKSRSGDDDESVLIIKEFLKKTVLDKIAKIQPKIEILMNVPKHTFSVRYKTSTWASNNLNSRNISYSSRLAHFNDDVLRYVVIHELAHFEQPNHSAFFWDVVEKFEPDYKVRRDQLRENKTPIS